MRKNDIQAQALMNLGSIWQGITQVKRNHGLGPGGSSVSTKSTRGTLSLRKAVAHEANKCFRGFTRMATIVRRTEDLIREEIESIAH